MVLFPLLASAAVLLLAGAAPGSAQVCPGFDPADAQPCTATPVVGSMCTLASASPRVRPTQPALGFINRDCKMDHFNSISDSKFAKYMADHPVPVVLGPNATLFVTDHHHLLAGLGRSTRAGADALFCATDDFSALPTWDAFFARMEQRRLVRLKDYRGENITASQLPASVADMTTDDPYRSLMEWVRNDNGFIKCDAKTAAQPECVASKGQNVPFLEFLWGDAMRPLFTFAPADVYSEDTLDQVKTMLPSLKKILATATAAAYADLPGFNSRGDFNISLGPVDPVTGCSDD